MPYTYKHDRISALGALTLSALRRRVGLYLRFQQRNFKAPDVSQFVRSLLRHLRGPVILLWDNGPIHKGPVIRRLQADYPRLHLELFPKYAPELNPAEQIWNDFKGHTANSLYIDLKHLHASLHGNHRRVRQSQAKLRSFILSSELPSPPC